MDWFTIFLATSTFPLHISKRFLYSVLNPRCLYDCFFSFLYSSHSKMIGMNVLSTNDISNPNLFVFLEIDLSISFSSFLFKSSIILSLILLLLLSFPFSDMTCFSVVLFWVTLKNGSAQNSKDCSLQVSFLYPALLRSSSLIGSGNTS